LQNGGGDALKGGRRDTGGRKKKKALFGEERTGFGVGGKQGGTKSVSRERVL